MQKRTFDELVQEYGRDIALSKFLHVQPHTKFYRKHVPSGSVIEVVVTPAAVRTKIGPFDERLFQSRWLPSYLQELVVQWNRQGHGIWEYWTCSTHP